MKDEVFILLPCYNEGQGIIRLLTELDNLLKNVNDRLVVTVIDDGSTDNTLQLLKNFKFSADNIFLHILELDVNLGHQQALEQGILYAGECKAAHAVILDSDGEDNPAAILKMLDLRMHDIVFVKRGKRGEGIVFRIAYGWYKLIFRILTGQKMNYGNYCMINRKVIGIVQNKSFVHLAAFLSKLRLKSTTVLADKRQRFSGKSKMTLSKLIHHAFRSFIEYAEECVMLFLKLSIFLFVLFVLTMGYVLYIKLFTDKAILGWTSTLGTSLLTSALLCIGFFTMGVLLLNQSQRRLVSATRAIYKVIK